VTCPVWGRKWGNNKREIYSNIKKKSEFVQFCPETKKKKLKI
jgi:hypothetical protein